MVQAGTLTSLIPWILGTGPDHSYRPLAQVSIEIIDIKYDIEKKCLLAPAEAQRIQEQPEKGP